MIKIILLIIFSHDVTLPYTFAKQMCLQFRVFKWVSAVMWMYTISEYHQNQWVHMYVANIICFYSSFILKNLTIPNYLLKKEKFAVVYYVYLYLIYLFCLYIY